MSASTPAAALRNLLAGSSSIAVPGGATPIEALCAAASGFEAFYVSGYAAAAWRSGVPDIGLTGAAEIIGAVAAITSSLRTPLALVVDADTGYGGIPNVARTVEGLESVGAAGIQIEDQSWPKRCGHLDGKAVIAAEEMILKVRAAVSARQDCDTVIIARTDARGPLGIKEAIARAQKYVDAGADAIFVDAPHSVAELEQIAAAVPGPLVVNMSESGRTPLLPLAQLQQMGYRLVLFPTAALRAATHAIAALFDDLRERGDTEPWLSRITSMDDVNTMLGLEDIRAFETGLLDS